VTRSTRTPLLVLLLTALAGPLAAQQEVYLKVTNPGLSRVVLGLPSFASVGTIDPSMASEFLTTLRRDLDQTVAIGVLPNEQARLVVVEPGNAALTRQRWRAVGAQFLLEGSLAGAGSQLVAEVRLWDLSTSEVAYARRFEAGVGLAATLAHTIANELVKLFTGKTGPFSSRIAFVSDRTGAKELWVMRWDGDAQQQLTSYRSITLGPAWSADGTLLAFTSFLRTAPELLMLRPSQGSLITLSTLPGVNSSPSFSPDGTRIAFAAGGDGDTDIYVVPAAGGAPERLTHTRGINTQPAWSPSGRQIVYTSTATGSPQLYIMDAEGTNTRRLTFEDSFADEAAWAPDGIRIAYTTRVDQRFQIATLDLRDGRRTVVEGPGRNESPCWSPDGTMLAFVSNRTGSAQIYITDPNGQPKQITRDGSNTQPAWVVQLQ